MLIIALQSLSTIVAVALKDILRTDGQQTLFHVNWAITTNCWPLLNITHFRHLPSYKFHFEILYFFLNIRHDPRSCSPQMKTWIIKHCQRHNGPEGWVHITSSNTNLDRIPEFWPSINFKISTKHQPLYKTIASKSWPNLASESRPRFHLGST